MKFFVKLYYSICNIFSNFFVNNEIIELINIIDDIGFEKFLIVQIYNNIMKKINHSTNKVNIYLKLTDLMQNISNNNITNFIYDNISIIKLNKLALFGFITINKHEEIIKEITTFGDIDILILYLTKIYSEFIFIRITELFKLYLSSQQIEIDDYTDNFNEYCKKIIDNLKNNNIEFIKNFKSLNEKYNNDILLIDKSLFKLS